MGSRLRRIGVHQARLGMFIHAFEGSWLSNPFWRRSFLLDDPGDLATLRDCGLAGIVIDEGKGVNVAAASAAPAPPPVAGREDESERPCSRAGEKRRAEAIVGGAKLAVQGLFDDVRLGRAVRSTDVRAVVDEVSASIRRNRHALIGVVRLKSADEYTYLHSVAVCALMVNFGLTIGYPAAMLHDLGLAGLFHDIGKMGVPQPILSKPGRLTEDEFAIVRTHSERGWQILCDGEGIPAVALDVCRHHHERFDGAGYPHGLAGEAIALEARMAAICDVYDALTSDRAYKNAWSPAEAATAMASWAGQFDRTLLFAFFQSLAVFPAGMIVRLASNRLAIVLPNGRRASRPRVRLFYSMAAERIVAPRDLVLGDDAAERILAEVDRADWPDADWDALCGHLLREAGDVDEGTVERLWRGADAARPAPAATVRPSPTEPDCVTWRPAALS